MAECTAGDTERSNYFSRVLHPLGNSRRGRSCDTPAVAGGTLQRDYVQGRIRRGPADGFRVSTYTSQSRATRAYVIGQLDLINRLRLRTCTWERRPFLLRAGYRFTFTLSGTRHGARIQRRMKHDIFRFASDRDASFPSSLCFSVRRK